MSNHLHVVIVMARCQQHRQLFGIRFEEKSGGMWAGDWAFALQETTSKKEGYDRNTIRGSLSFDPEYPGCPHCHASSIFKCSCGKVNCWDGESETVTCAWCGSTGRLEGTIDSLSGGGDR